jgi:cysteinyl-tRNA synthetase
MSLLKLYDTRKKQKTPFSSLREGKVSFYSCGPTVYNRVHIGNLRAFLFADTLQRYLRFGKNQSVQWVMNITDVDDKTIRDSQKKFAESDPKVALKKFTKIYTQKFFVDIKKLNIQKSHFFSTPRATDYIDAMQSLVQKIVDNGFGYEKDGSVYFDVQKYSKSYEYGQLVNIDFANMESTSRMENDEYDKSSASDFVLWKAKKEGEPFWNFDICGKNCPGRPGWHLECSAMEKEVLGLPFDIHSGGVDLCFPHHEDEIAQSVAGYGIDPSAYWVHNEHLMVEGKKMSKSLGNFYTLEDLEEKGFFPEVVRFFLVSHHYRTKVNLTDESLSGAENQLKRIRNFLALVVSKKDVPVDPDTGLSTADMQNFRQKFFKAMDDDLNVSVALAEFFEFVKKASQLGLAGVSTKAFSRFVAIVNIVENIMGVSFFPQEEKIPEKITALFEERKKARAEKNWAESDRLRDEIFALGYEVRDGSEGASLCKI